MVGVMEVADALVNQGPELAAELWRRVRMEFRVELPLLRKKIWLMGGCILFQYVHGMATQLAYRLHVPTRQPLPDTGFALIPELGEPQQWVSEAIFVTLLLSLFCWLFSPFVSNLKRFYTVTMATRILTCLVSCQCLRILSFLSTGLPGPNYHCRAPRDTSMLDWPEHWWGHFIVDVGRQSTKSCGDLIFSSHTTFVLTLVLAYQTVGGVRALKLLAWAAAAALSVLIIASRKHYTVDVLVAWYTVPLVWCALARRWTTHRHIPSAAAYGTLSEANPDDASERGAELVQLSEVIVDRGSQRAGTEGSHQGDAFQESRQTHEGNSSVPGPLSKSKGTSPKPSIVHDSNTSSVGDTGSAGSTSGGMAGGRARVNRMGGGSSNSGTEDRNRNRQNETGIGGCKIS